MATMNIYAPSGTLVMVTDTSAKNGYTSDEQQIEKHCKIGDVYHVTRTIVHSSSSEVYLKEFPGIAFNTVNFETHICPENIANKTFIHIETGKEYTVLGMSKVQIDDEWVGGFVTYQSNYQSTDGNIYNRPYKVFMKRFELVED
jgi:hypothetical protein